MNTIKLYDNLREKEKKEETTASTFETLEACSAAVEHQQYV
jgi:hypothetical protein